MQHKFFCLIPSCACLWLVLASMRYWAIRYLLACALAGFLLSCLALSGVFLARERLTCVAAVDSEQKSATAGGQDGRFRLWDTRGHSNPGKVKLHVGPQGAGAVSGIVMGMLIVLPCTTVVIGCK